MSEPTFQGTPDELSFRRIAAELPEAILERYQPLAELGRGGMGYVFRARDRRLRREVAIKVVKGPRNNELLRGRFLREAKLLGGFEHPGVLRVFDFGEAEDVLYLVTECLYGRPLSSKRFPREDAPERLLQIADALDALHSQGLIHRDLKPGNIMLEPDGRVVLIDFGLARTEEGGTLTKTGYLAGTLLYLAPELFQGARPAASADWWALGVTAYRLLEGEFPFPVRDFPQIQFFQDDPTLVFVELDTDDPLRRAIRELLRLDPDRRPASRRALEGLLEGRRRGPGIQLGVQDTLALPSAAEAPRVESLAAPDSSGPEGAEGSPARPRRSRDFRIPWILTGFGFGALFFCLWLLGGGEDPGRAGPRARPASPSSADPSPQLLAFQKSRRSFEALLSRDPDQTTPLDLSHAFRSLLKLGALLEDAASGPGWPPELSKEAFPLFRCLVRARIWAGWRGMVASKTMVAPEEEFWGVPDPILQRTSAGVDPKTGAISRRVQPCVSAVRVDWETRFPRGAPESEPFRNRILSDRERLFGVFPRFLARLPEELQGLWRGPDWSPTRAQRAWAESLPRMDFQLIRDLVWISFPDPNFARDVLGPMISNLGKEELFLESFAKDFEGPLGESWPHPGNPPLAPASQRAGANFQGEARWLEVLLAMPASREQKQALDRLLANRWRPWVFALAREGQERRPSSFIDVQHLDFSLCWNELEDGLEETFQRLGASYSKARQTWSEIRRLMRSGKGPDG